jgi:hypothetical protein
MSIISYVNYEKGVNLESKNGYAIQHNKLIHNQRYPTNILTLQSQDPPPRLKKRPKEIKKPNSM